MSKIAVIKRLIREYGNKCYYCGGQISKKERTVDHFHPLSMGGSEMFTNYRLACKRCNQIKADLIFTEEDFFDIEPSKRIDVIIEKKNLISALKRCEMEIKSLNAKIVELKKWKIETERWKKVAKHYLEVLNIVIKKFNKRTLEELIK